MDERDLYATMRQAVSAAPPPMSDEPVLAAAQHALKRRRAVWASSGSAAVVTLVAVGVAVLAPSQSDDGGVQAANRPPAVQDTRTSASTKAAGKTETPPGGQTNATATAGPHYDRAVALAAALDELAPAGYGTPDDLMGAGDYADRPLKTHKAMRVGTVNGTEVWNYAAGTPLTKDTGVGELLATVYSPGGESTGEGCALTPTAWDATDADCTEVMVDGKKVAVVDVRYPARDALPPVQWAGYRHADGAVTFVMQTADVRRSGRPALAAMPMTGQQLAALAADARLKAQ